MLDEQVIPAAEQEQTAASSTEATTATESATGDSNESQTEGEAKAKGGFQRRIDKLTRVAADKEREAEFWRAEALRNKPVETKTDATVVATAKPKEDDFATHSEYVEALTDWKVDQKVKTFEARQNEEKAKTHQQTVAQSYQSKEQEYKASVPDFDEVLAEADFPVSPAVFEEIATNENGPAFKYFLAKNPDEAERLSKLTPVALAREVGRLESRFTTAPQKIAAKVTQAPAPPNPVGKSSSTSAKSMYDDDLPPAEYQALRRKQYPNLR